MAYESIPAVTVDCQQGKLHPQGDDVEIPAEAAIRLLAVRQCFDTKMALEGMVRPSSMEAPP